MSDFRQTLERGRFGDAAMPVAKKARAEVDGKLKKACWILHNGPHAKDMLCPLCGVQRIREREKGSWEAGHVVAYAWFEQSAKQECKYDLVPLCRGCNLSMGTQNLWSAML